MLIATTNESPGCRVEHAFSEVFGRTVRSRHLRSDIGAGLKSPAGGVEVYAYGTAVGVRPLDANQPERCPTVSERGNFAAIASQHLGG
ncbi:MAG: heavy metal-binding domain-containing protein [Gordonia sp. (in: high G+C Gram-positive bacteria)]